MKETLLSCLSSLLLLNACEYPVEFETPEPIVSFENEYFYHTANDAKNSEKRGFNDYNGDGITDMIEIDDEAFWGQDYYLYLFEGYKDPQSNLLKFKPKKTSKISLEINNWATLNKLDTGDINGDGLADLIYTSYTEGFSSDDINIQIGINQGDGLNYKWITKKMVEKKNTFLSLSMFVLELFAAYGGGSGDDSVSDYFQMDWGDANADGKDDLLLFWKDTSHGLTIIVLHSETEKENPEEIQFGFSRELYIKNVMFNKKAKHIDTGDFNGDAYLDLQIRYPLIGDDIEIRHFISLFTVKSPIPYAIEPDTKYPEQDDFDYSLFEKYDNFDVNFDGCDDFVHIGLVDGLPKMYVKTVNCQKTKENAKKIGEYFNQAFSLPERISE